MVGWLSSYLTFPLSSVPRLLSIFPVSIGFSNFNSMLLYYFISMVSVGIVVVVFVGCSYIMCSCCESVNLWCLLYGCGDFYYHLHICTYIPAQRIKLLLTAEWIHEPGLYAKIHLQTQTNKHMHNGCRLFTRMNTWFTR